MSTGGKTRVLVGMSGGVDSSVTAYLLAREGYDVIGVTMLVWDGTAEAPPGGRSGCFGPGEAEDVESARSVAARLGIEHACIDVRKEYRRCVLDYFRGEYRCGRTPNPCYVCNRTVKFGYLQQKAREMGIRFDRFATGHYAVVEQATATGRWLLRRAVHAAKDQSYFLSGLSQEQLSTLLLPLGQMTKDEVRQVARGIGLGDVAERHESQDFMDDGEYGTLFDGQDMTPGEIVDPAGRVLGTHRGLVRYTVGQRKGLGIGGASEPLYVVAIDAGRNRVVVGPREMLFSDSLVMRDVNWVSEAGLAAPRKVTVKIRQQHEAAAAVAAPAGADVHVRFDAPQMAITPGQAAVMYEGDTVIAAGIIDKDG